MSYKICALIPTYNHVNALDGIITKIKEFGLEIFIVDDGSNDETQAALQKLCKNEPHIHLIRVSSNKGKGAAVQTGMRQVAKAGFTHALQVDADGQHSLDHLQSFLDISKRNPQALLSGHPIYDDSMPLNRRIGRWLTHIWVWIETLSFRISDSMCGFRIYPVEKTLSIMDQVTIGSRMDFDTEIMVRHFWNGTPVILSPVKVTYPKGNLSNFKVISDNWRITKMHTRLVISLLINLKRVLLNRPNYVGLDLQTEFTHWASLRERGSIIGLFFLVWCYRLLGKRGCVIIGSPIILYFYITGKSQRQASKNYLNRVFYKIDPKRKSRFTDSFRHFMSFFDACIDKFAAWTGRMDLCQIEEEGLKKFKKIMEGEKGGILLTSHLGNMEFCRAVANPDHKSRLYVLLHSRNAQRFNQILRVFNPDCHINIIEVTETGPETIIYLKDRIALGDWVVIAADRVPINGNSRVSFVSFLGKEAPFSHGPFVLSSLLKCPVYTAFAVREGQQFRIFLNHFAEEIIIDRTRRQSDLNDYIKKYADHLEHYCLLYPYQWFNFFDFWKSTR